MTQGRKKIPFTDGQIRRCVFRIKSGDTVAEIARDMHVSPIVVSARLREAGHDPFPKTQKPATA